MISVNAEVVQVIGGHVAKNRKGTVVEVKDERCRVSWHTDRNGKPFGRNLRTWVQAKFLAVNGPDAAEEE